MGMRPQGRAAEGERQPRQELTRRRSPATRSCADLIAAAAGLCRARTFPRRSFPEAPARPGQGCRSRPHSGRGGSGAAISGAGPWSRHRLVTASDRAGSPQGSRLSRKWTSAQSQHRRPIPAWTGPSGAGPWHSLQVPSNGVLPSQVVPGGGVLVRGVFRRRRARRRNRPGGQPAGPGWARCFSAGKARQRRRSRRGARGPEKDLERPGRAQREAGCAPGRACETDQAGMRRGPRRREPGAGGPKRDRRGSERDGQGKPPCRAGRIMRAVEGVERAAPVAGPVCWPQEPAAAVGDDGSAGQCQGALQAGNGHASHGQATGGQLREQGNQRRGTARPGQVAEPRPRSGRSRYRDQAQPRGGTACPGMARELVRVQRPPPSARGLVPGRRGPPRSACWPLA